VSRSGCHANRSGATRVSAHLSVDEVMAEVRGRVRERLQAELARAHPDSPLLDDDIFGEAEALFRRALDHRRRLVLPALLMPDDDWELATGLRFGSHRPLVGPLLVFLKRRVLLPLTRWLYEFSADNFVRQVRINETLMASIETLVVELVMLRRDVDRLRRAVRSAGTGPDADQ